MTYADALKHGRSRRTKCGIKNPRKTITKITMPETTSRNYEISRQNPGVAKLLDNLLPENLAVIYTGYKRPDFTGMIVFSSMKGIEFGRDVNNLLCEYLDCTLPGIMEYLGCTIVYMTQKINWPHTPTVELICLTMIYRGHIGLMYDYRSPNSLVFINSWLTPTINQIRSRDRNIPDPRKFGHYIVYEGEFTTKSPYDCPVCFDEEIYQEYYYRHTLEEEYFECDCHSLTCETKDTRNPRTALETGETNGFAWRGRKRHVNKVSRFSWGYGDRACPCTSCCGLMNQRSSETDINKFADSKNIVDDYSVSP